ncbi:sodium-dependent phosphate transport protein 1-like [Pteronotus mesoamericanus]|uniref:sodium-dependent phosphate transport protein 1-like n=1 Tax=Pteronotus mesoamericanus TaxID=1884717 RepID=UPI0023EE21CC|nr:sodium-dependent phosphate transport protein 1-like [Pteronotus parnellii mesoamericanus]
MDHPSPPRKAPTLCSLRTGLALLLHFCNVALLSQRVCLSLTMVAMVNRSEPRGAPNASLAAPLDNVKNPVYNWSPQTQGIILSAIMYGMPLIHIPMGYLAGICPVKKVVGSALLLSSLLSLCTPLAAEAGESLVIACRFFQGLSQGTVQVAQHMVWIKWAPPLERNRLTSVSLSGTLLGPSVALLVTGFVSQSLGWPMVFYIFGAGGCALSLLWFVLFYDDPEEHPCISLHEKDLLRSSLAEQVSSGGKSVPVTAMLTSLPVWAISLSGFAFSWTNTIAFLYMPTFISSKLHIEMRENGLLSALPHLLSWVLSILAGHAADFFLARKILRLVTIRKLFTTLGLLPPALLAVSVLHPSVSPLSSVVGLTLASATAGFCMAGLMINPLDIAPRYYGFLKGVTVLIAMVGGLISSTLTGIMLNQDPDSWFKIFLLMAAINVTSILFYLIFAKADVQDWAKEWQGTRL